MNASEPKSFVTGRILCGTFTGAVFGLLIQVMFHKEPPDDRRILFVGPLIGAAVVAAVAACFGGRKLPSAIKTISIATLSGTVVGFIGGWFVYPLIMMAFLPARPVFDEKILAFYQSNGAFVGISIGTALGFSIGVLIWLSKSPTPRV